MDATVIFLFAIICVLAYVLYMYFRPSTITSGVVPLGNVNTIPATSIIQPTASVYYYDLWLFVNSPVSSYSTIFSHGSFNLGLEGNTLKAKKDTTDIMQVTDSFPMQKWVFVTIVVNENIMEAYLNGKLVKTTQMTDANKPVHLGTDMITYGNAGLQGHLTRFNRLPEKTTSTDVWNKYLNGNGVSATSSPSGKYGIELEVSKNNQPFGFYKLF